MGLQWTESAVFVSIVLKTITVIKALILANQMQHDLVSIKNLQRDRFWPRVLLPDKVKSTELDRTPVAP